MENKVVKAENTDEYQHYLCETIIRYLYGENVDVERYKVYHDKEKSFGRLCGVDITRFDLTTKKHVPKYQVEYDDKVSEALTAAKFSRKYGDLHMHDEGQSMFKAIIKSRVYKFTNSNKSVLCIYQK